MSQSNKASIILPVFNAEQHINQAMESVLSQTYENWELIVCDNCSTDNTYKIVQRYAVNDSRIKLARNETNIGVMPNYNQCIKLSTGKYIEIFGCDDYFEPACIEKFVGALDEQPNVVLVTSTRNVIDAAGNLTSINQPYQQSQLLKGDAVIRQTIQSLNNWISSPVMFRSEFKGRGVNTNIPLYGDLDYWCQMLKHGDLYFIDEALFNYRMHDKSSTTKMVSDLTFLPDVLRMVDRYAEYFACPGESTAEGRRRLQQKLVDWIELAAFYHKYDMDCFLAPSQVDISTFPLPEFETVLTQMHDYRRAALHGLMFAVEQGRNFREERRQLEEYANAIECELQSIKHSTSWKITAPLRQIVELVRSGGHVPNLVEINGDPHQD